MPQFTKFLMYWVVLLSLFIMPGNFLIRDVMEKNIYLPKAISFCKAKGYKFGLLIYQVFNANGKLKKYTTKYGTRSGRSSLIAQGCICSNPIGSLDNPYFEVNFLEIPDMWNNFISFIAQGMLNIILIVVPTCLAYKLSFQQGFK